MSARSELLRVPEKPITVIGSVGIDAQGIGHLPTDTFPLESKTPVSYNELDDIKKAHGIQVVAEEPGQTGTNFAVGLQKLHGENARVQFIAPFAPEDPHADKIRTTITSSGLDLQEVHHTDRNPYSLVISNGGKVALVAKPTELPTITPDHIHPNAEMIMIASLGGRWEETYNTVLDGKNGKALGLIGSESQITKLPKDKKKKEAYGRVLAESNFLLANDTEAGKILEIVYGQKPQKDPLELALQLHDTARLQETSLTFGKEGSIFVDKERTLHILKVKPLENIVGTVGAGDANAAAIAYGRTSGQDIEPSMVNAAKSSASVIGVLDSLSGQMRHDQWDRKATAGKHGMRYEIHTPRERTKKTTIFTS